MVREREDMQFAGHFRRCLMQWWVTNSMTPCQQIVRGHYPDTIPVSLKTWRQVLSWSVQRNPIHGPQKEGYTIRRLFLPALLSTSNQEGRLQSIDPAECVHEILRIPTLTPLCFLGNQAAPYSYHLIIQMELVEIRRKSTSRRAPLIRGSVTESLPMAKLFTAVGWVRSQTLLRVSGSEYVRVGWSGEDY